MNDGESEGKGPPQTYTPWLVVRATPSDTGSRTPPIAQFWASPDIAVAPSDTWGRVQVGQEVTVSVTVQNLGLAAAIGVRARFWWCDPSGAVSPGSAHPIGISKRVSIPAGLDDTLDCIAPWTPVFVNGGHECLVVEVSCLSDPLQHSFRPDLDRHVGQRNVTVLEPDAEATTTLLTLTNPFDEPSWTTLHVRSTTLFGAERLVGFGLPIAPINAVLHADDPALADPFGSLGIESENPKPGTGAAFGDVVLLDVQAGGFAPETQQLLREDGADAHEVGPVVASAELGPRGQAQVAVKVASGGQSGGVLTTRITQVSAGVVVGGYTIVSAPF